MAENIQMKMAKYNPKTEIGKTNNADAIQKVTELLRASGISDHGNQEIENRKWLMKMHSNMLREADSKSVGTLYDQIMEISFNDKLPTKLLRLIFGYCEDVESLLNCRLVCKHWKKAIDKPSSSNLMRRLTFNIYDYHSFYESTLIDVVKSVRIILPWKDINSSNSYLHWSEFTNRIGQTVQKIIFDFQRPNHISNEEFINRSNKIILSLLADCHKLEDLHILNENVLSSLGDDESNLQMMPKCENIKILVLVKTAKPFQKIFEFFPNLVKLHLKDTEEIKGVVNWTLVTSEAMRKINNMLFEIVKLKRGTLQEIMLDKGTCYQYCEEWYNLIFACYHYGIKLTLNSADDQNMEFPILDVKYLLSHIETAETPINEKTCQYFQSGDFSFGLFTGGAGTHIPQDTRRLEFCTNLTQLRIIFWQLAILEELKFLSKLQKLKSVSLSGVAFGMLRYSYELARCLLEVLNLLCTESLVCLEIKWNLFGSVETEQMAKYFVQFKNLKTIVLKFMPLTPNDIFVQLSKLLFLQIIEFHIPPRSEIEVRSLTDDMFTHFCESQREDSKGFMVPDITAFNKLRWLNIGFGDYADLTYAFIVNGIALSETLTDVLLWNMREQLTKTSFEAVGNTGFKEMNTKSYPRLIRLKRDVRKDGIE